MPNVILNWNICKRVVLFLEQYMKMNFGIKNIIFRVLNSLPEP